MVAAGPFTTICYSTLHFQRELAAEAGRESAAMIQAAPMRALLLWVIGFKLPQNHGILEYV